MVFSPFLVPDFEITFPYNVDQYARQKLDAKIEREQHFYLHFRAFGQDFHLNVSLYANAAPSNQVIEHHSQEGVKRLIGKEAFHTTGQIVNDTDSWVTLDHSSGMVSN